MTLMVFLLSSEVMRFDEVLSSKMHHHGDLGRRFYRAGPDRMWKSLKAIIQQASLQGALKTDNAGQAAEDLIALWFDMVPLKHRFNAIDSPSKLEIGRRVNRGVDSFLKLYGCVDRTQTETR